MRQFSVLTDSVAYRQGREARIVGKTESACPYDSKGGSGNARYQWFMGFYDVRWSRIYDREKQDCGEGGKSEGKKPKPLGHRPMDLERRKELSEAMKRMGFL